MKNKKKEAGKEKEEKNKGRARGKRTNKRTNEQTNETKEPLGIDWKHCKTGAAKSNASRELRDNDINSYNRSPGGPT